MNTYIDLVGKTESIHAESCKVCSEKIIYQYNVEQHYIGLLSLPLFPSKRIIYRICPKCNAKLKIKIKDPDFDWVNQTIPKRFSFKYYWGNVVLAVIAFLLWYWYKSVMK